MHNLKLDLLMKDVAKWSNETFKYENNSTSTLSMSYHLKEESLELIESLNNYYKDPKENTHKHAVEELTDCMLLVLDIASHFDLTAEQLLTECYNKLEINKNRKWGLPDENGVIKHIE